MAINDYPGKIRPAAPPCVACGQDADAMVRWPAIPAAAHWAPHCNHHVPWVDPAAEFVFVDLDPTRQRRPSYVRVQSADDRPGTTGPYVPAKHRPDPAP